MREVSGAAVREIVNGELGSEAKEIEAGMPIACLTITGGYEPTTVRGNVGVGFYAESEFNVYQLSMADDDRNCWVTHGAVNKKCIQRLKRGT